MGECGRRAKPGDGLAVEQRELNAKIMQAFKDAEDARIRLLGALAILVEDGIISSGRARELGAMTIEEQRAHLRNAIAQ